MGRIKNLIRPDNDPIAQALLGIHFQYGTGAQGQPGLVHTFHDNNDEECMWTTILWVTVDLKNNMVYLYNEYDCGGMLWSRDVKIPDDIRNDTDTFMDWLDDLIG